MSETGHENRQASCPVGGSGASASILPGRSIRRWFFLLVGLLSVALGFIGVFVPGLPTTVFLILASYFFTRSCPWLEEKLVRAPVFKPYLRYLDGDRAMPLRARVATIAMIWAAVGSSFLLMGAKGALSGWFVGVVGGAALIGSVVVAFVFRGRPSA